MKPTPMLIGAFKIQVRREFALLHMRTAQHGFMRCARIKPHVNRVRIFQVILRIIAQHFFGRDRLPRLNAALLYALRHFLQQFTGTRMQCAGFSVYEKRHRHAPLPLPRERPIRAIRDHRVQPRLAPRGEKLCGFNGRERGVAQGVCALSRSAGEGWGEGARLSCTRYRTALTRPVGHPLPRCGSGSERGRECFGHHIHPRKPLIRRAINDRCAMAPAVHVAVIEFFGFKERAGLAHVFHDFRIRIPNRKPAELGQCRCVFAVTHYRRQHIRVLHAIRAA